ncbi:MAG: carboxypeptidase-like regulatory domain-containing protein [Bacteroidota bacterium]
MKQNFVILIITLLLTTVVTSGFYSGDETGTIKGTVTDKKTNDPLPGVFIAVAGTNITTYSDLNGNFEIKNLKAGTIELKVKCVSYNGTVVSVVLAAGATQVVLIKLKN